MEAIDRTYHFKKTLEKKERFVGGHRLCAGCGAGIAVRGVLRALREEDRAVVGNATGCLEVSSFLYPYTAYEDSYIHTAFESAGATLSGVEAAYNALKRKGQVKGEVKFITFGGDGGTYDIGFQSLSGAMERGHDLTYVCYDNEAYMNTGIQKSSLTPFGASTTTTPAGKREHGCLTQKKSLFDIVAAHRIPYAATASVGYLNDFTKKVERARDIKGTRFIHVMAPCPVGWGFPSADMVDVAKEIVDTGLWYLAEYEGPALTGTPGGRFRLNRDPKQFKPIEPYLRRQGRFSADDGADLALIERARDERWSYMRETWG